MAHLIRRSWLSVVVLICAFPQPARTEPEESAKVYQSVLKSVVWIQSPREKGRVATGTGTLIDKDRRLILTNYHVVGNNDRVSLVFPAYRGTKLIAEREYYIEHLKREGGVRGKVVAKDKTRDLALVQLDKLPEGVQALPLAAESVSPGQSVQSVGNPGDSGALWVYTPGKVRQVYHKRWKAKLGDETANFEADVVETDSATNAGDSGGPLVNDKAQLVGVTQGGAVNARLLSYFIDVGEVKLFLNGREVKAIGGATPDAPHKTQSFEVRDGGKFFSEEAIKKANEEIKEITKKYNAEILIETFAAPPDGMADKVKAMTVKERETYFKEWAAKRVKAENVHGLYMLVCREPAHFYAEVAGTKARAVLDEAYTKRIIARLLELFREKKFDEGLATAVKMVRERWADPIANP